MTKIKIAVIGSRETRIEIMKMMFDSIVEIVDSKIPDSDVLLTSGGCALGPDTVAIKLSNRIPCEIYLPDDKKLYLKRYYPNANFFVHSTNDNYKAIIDRIHPNPKALKDFVYLLHGRNIDVIDRLGKGRVDCVYYAAMRDKNGTITGGTRMACEYAKEVNVPIFNAIDENHKFKEFVNNFV